MTSDMILNIGRDFEDVFFLIGGALLAIELLKLLFSREKKARPVLDMVASASTQLPFLLVETFLLGFVYLGFVYASDAWVSWTLPINVWTILLAVLAADITYYWEHRMAHRIRILWTQHAVHHSSRHFNIVTSIRFGPFEGMISALAHFPLILMGFPARACVFRHHRGAGLSNLDPYRIDWKAWPARIGAEHPVPPQSPSWMRRQIHRQELWRHTDHLGSSLRDVSAGRRDPGLWSETRL